MLLLQLRVLTQLARRDALLFFNNLPTILVRSLVWPTQKALLFGYLLPTMGLGRSFGLFYLAAIVATIPIFRIVPACGEILNDLEGEKIIEYELLLMLPLPFVLGRKALWYAFETFLISIIALPWGLVLLWGNDLSSIAPLKVVGALFCISIFFGFFTLLCASIISHSQQLRLFWSIFMHTLWIFGCFFFSWSVLHKLYPTWAYLDLLNPSTHAMEMMRVALLGQQNFINYYISGGVLLVSTFFVFTAAIALFKRRLDLI